MTTIAIAGATGAVGQQMLECLKERNIQADLKLLASARSKGKDIDGHIVEELTKDSFQGVDYVLGATGNDITKMWMPWAKEAGCIVVDNSSAYRLDNDVPLVIPEVNKEDIKNHHGLIANPNCATIIALVALQALHKKYHIKRMIVTTFQAVSGAGVQGIEDLKNQNYICLSKKMGRNFYKDFIQAFKLDGIKPKIIKEVDTFEQLTIDVSLDKGVALVSKEVVNENIAKAIPIINTHHHNDYVIAYHKDCLEIEQRFIKEAIRYFETL